MCDDDDDKTNHQGKAELLTIIPAVSRDEDDALEGMEEEEDWEESDLSSDDDNEDNPFPEDFPRCRTDAGRLSLLVDHAIKVVRFQCKVLRR